jgi:hypothetical protein
MQTIDLEKALDTRMAAMEANIAALLVKATTPPLPTGAATHEGQDEVKALIGTTGDAPASISADETALTLSSLIALGKALKNLDIDAVAHLATIAGAVSNSKLIAGYDSNRVDVLFTGIGATAQYEVVGALVEVPNWASSVGRSATIREMRISVNNNAIAPQFEVHFFRASDVTYAADNAPWTEIAAEYAKRAGYIIMPACAKATGSGTIDMIRAQLDDYGQAASKEITCAAASSSIWIGLKLIASGISFAVSPGNSIVLSIVREKS